jgi:hypothetical protein
MEVAVSSAENVDKFPFLKLPDVVTFSILEALAELT